MYKAKDISCLILAAGSESRFGSAKLLYRLKDGRSILQNTIGVYQSVFDQVTVVCNDNMQLIDQAHNLGALIEVNPLAHLGMSESIKLGVRVTQASTAWLIVLADMPYVDAVSIVRLCQFADRKKIIQPYFNSSPGNPVMIGTAFLPQLMSLEGDVGAKAILQTHSQALIKLDLDDSGLVHDIDTLDDVKS